MNRGEPGEMMEYKGYFARVEFVQDAGVLYGEVEGLRDVVTFETTDVKDLERVFRESVDDYLAMCAERDEQPDKPYSGKFLVRVDPALHREVAIAAAGAGKSLNAFANEMIKDWLERASHPRASRPAPGANANQPGRPDVVVYPEHLRPQSEAPENVDATTEGNPDLFQPGARHITPGSRTPRTPGGSRTPSLQDIAA